MRNDEVRLQAYAIEVGILQGQSPLALEQAHSVYTKAVKPGMSSMTIQSILKHVCSEASVSQAALVTLILKTKSRYDR